MSGYNFKKDCFLLSEDLFYLYSVEPDEMQQCAAFHLGFHCLLKFWFRGFPENRVDPAQLTSDNAS